MEGLSLKMFTGDFFIYSSTIFYSLSQKTSEGLGELRRSLGASSNDQLAEVMHST